jgi:ABC-type glycerol-3-phosphate transport system substrate-binding protein
LVATRDRRKRFVRGGNAVRNSRKTTRLVPLAALAVLAAACGGGGDEGGGGGGSSSTELRIATWSDWEFLQDLADQYTEENPDVSIQIDAIPGQEYFDNLPRTLGLEEAPDITILQVTQVGLYRQLVEDGLLLDVNDIWESQGLEDVTPQAVVDTYTEEDGSRYAVNSGLTFLPAVYYNKEIFEELGLEVPEGGRLSSYDELGRIVQALDEAGHLPMTYNWEEAHHMFQQNLQSSCGEEDYVALGSSWQPGSEPTISWTDDCVVNAITAYADLAEAGTFGRDPLMGFDVAMAGFTSGQSGMLTTGMWAVDQIQEEADFDFGWFLMPPIEGGQDDTRWVLWLADGLGIAANSPNQELAKDFLEFTMTQEAQSSMPRPPSRTDVEPTNVDPALGEMITSLDDLGTTTHFIQVLAPPDFQDVIQSSTEEVLLGSKTPAEMAQDLEELAESLRNDG